MLFPAATMRSLPLVVSATTRFVSRLIVNRQAPTPSMFHNRTVQSSPPDATRECVMKQTERILSVCPKRVSTHFHVVFGLHTLTVLSADPEIIILFFLWNSMHSTAFSCPSRCIFKVALSLIYYAQHYILVPNVNHIVISTGYKLITIHQFHILNGFLMGPK